MPPALLPAAGVVLAGGRSRRMGAAKAGLAWHGSTLLERTVGVLARVLSGPVVVVRAPGQELPPVAYDVLLRDDPVEGRGPLQGLAVGLAAAGGHHAAFVCSVDLPFLHPVWVRAVVGALGPDDDAVLPVAGGFRQPLAAAYRTSLASVCADLVAQDRLRPAALLGAVRTRVLDDAALRAALGDDDPDLDSVAGVNTPEELAAARARPLPEVRVLPGGRALRAATVAGLGGGAPVQRLGRPADAATPLVPGDVVTVLPA